LVEAREGNGNIFDDLPLLPSPRQREYAQPYVFQRGQAGNDALLFWQVGQADPKRLRAGRDHRIILSIGLSTFSTDHSRAACYSYISKSSLMVH
jgi:hypothetical protein